MESMSLHAGVRRLFNIRLSIRTEQTRVDAEVGKERENGHLPLMR